MAQKCWDEEVERRGLDEGQQSDVASDDEAGDTEASFGGNVDACWLDEAVCRVLVPRRSRRISSVRSREGAG